MSDNAYNDFHDSLNATGVLSPEYKRTLGAILSKAMEQAFKRGREQSAPTPAQVTLLNENADTRAQLEVVKNRRDGLLREVAEKCVKITSLERDNGALRSQVDAQEATIQSLFRSRDDALLGAAKLREIISEQPDERDFNDATPQERDAIKLARSAGVVSTQLEACIRFANESGLGASEITPSRLRRLGALAFVLARRRERSAG